MLTCPHAMKMLPLHIFGQFTSTSAFRTAFLHQRSLLSSNALPHIIQRHHNMFFLFRADTIVRINNFLFQRKRAILIVLRLTRFQKVICFNSPAGNR